MKKMMGGLAKTIIGMMGKIAGMGGLNQLNPLIKWPTAGGGLPGMDGMP